MTASYNGWPASSSPSAIGINQNWEPIRGHKFPQGTKSGDVETVFTYLVRQLDERVEPIEEYAPGDEWGYSYRANVNNPSQLSCHASGTAIDYNATQHPNRVDYTWSREQTRIIHQIINDELDGVVKWLEGWDEMHFEIRGTTAQVAAVAKKIRGGITSTSQPAPPVVEEVKKILKENETMLVIRRAKKEHRLFLTGGFTYVAHDTLVTATPTTPTMEVDDNMWNKLIAVAKFIGTFQDPRPA